MTSPLHAPIAKAMGDLVPAALGARVNAPALELSPFEHPIRFLDATVEHRWVDLYLRSNLHAFGGPLSLPGWVLVDLYLLPSAIGLLLGKAGLLPPATREALSLAPEDEAILAAYVAVPCAEPGVVMGVSLFSLVPRRGAARAVKALTLGMLGAKRQRGIAQLSSESLRVHTRMGPMRVLGPSPRAHEHAAESFVYEVDLSDEERWASAFEGRPPSSPVVRIGIEERGRLHRMTERAYHGHRVEILWPGLSPEGTHVVVSEGSEAE